MWGPADKIKGWGQDWLPPLTWLLVSQGTTVREAKVHVWVDAGELASEVCVWSVSSWDFMCFQGWVVSELCGTEFWLHLLFKRGWVLFLIQSILEVSWHSCPLVPPPCGVSFHYYDYIMKSRGQSPLSFSSVLDWPGFSQSLLLSISMTPSGVSCH